MERAIGNPQCQMPCKTGLVSMDVAWHPVLRLLRPSSLKLDPMLWPPTRTAMEMPLWTFYCSMVQGINGLEPCGPCQAGNNVQGLQTTNPDSETNGAN